MGDLGCSYVNLGRRIACAGSDLVSARSRLQEHIVGGIGDGQRRALHIAAAGRRSAFDMETLDRRHALEKAGSAARDDEDPDFIFS